MKIKKERQDYKMEIKNKKNHIWNYGRILCIKFTNFGTIWIVSR